VIGLWVGLSTGLILAGGVMLFVWNRQIHRLARQLDLENLTPPAPPAPPVRLRSHPS